MTTIQCLHCGAETSNGLALCGGCITTATVSLVNIASYHTDALNIQPGERVKVRSAYQSTPPPALDPRHDPVSAVCGHVDAIIVGWVRNLEDDRAIETKAHTTTAACAWLEQHLTTIGTLDWAGEFVREMRDCEGRLERLLDRTDTGWYAGRCENVLEGERLHDGQTCACACHETGACDMPGGCGDAGVIGAVLCPRPLYVNRGKGWVRCPECGMTWDAEARRVRLVKQAADELAPVRALARVIVGITDEVSEERLTRRIEKWIDRKQLHDYGVRVLDGRPRRVYRIGDVLKLVTGEVRPRDAEAC